MPVFQDLDKFFKAQLNIILDTEQVKFWRQTKVIAGNQLAISNQANHLYQTGHYQNTPANGDEIQAYFTLPEGMFSLSLCGAKLSSGGIHDVIWQNPDGQASPLTLANFDWYASTTAYGTIQQTANFQVSTPGKKEFRFRVTGKSSSSAGHRIEMVFIQVTGQ